MINANIMSVNSTINTMSMIKTCEGAWTSISMLCLVQPSPMGTASFASWGGALWGVAGSAQRD